MHYYVVSALDEDTVCRIIDVLSHPPATNKYKGTSDESYWPQRNHKDGMLFGSNHIIIYQSQACQASNSPLSTRVVTAMDESHRNNLTISQQ
ncbi:hypothetical protein T4E_5717 [Trichinella pseudospiralis]|uniref:Uncharacterized protein n=1 Tax=Trichinella pseudospiralis TaxID=6337 RepID=A0A0V0YLZ2_TRIPS|nr:hypothetical protein T4E_5717 [Trichinella pseudospiralis]